MKLPSAVEWNQLLSPVAKIELSHGMRGGSNQHLMNGLVDKKIKSRQDWLRPEDQVLTEPIYYNISSRPGKYVMFGRCDGANNFFQSTELNLEIYPTGATLFVHNVNTEISYNTHWN